VRIFFGHVCGSNQFLSEWYAERYRTLDDFYAELAKNRTILREWIPPP
jgi:hypothetical protein